MFLSREIDIKLCQNYTSDKAIKDIVANRASPSLHSGSFEITLTVPLNTIPGIRWKSWNLKGGRKGMREKQSYNSDFYSFNQEVFGGSMFT